MAIYRIFTTILLFLVLQANAQPYIRDIASLLNARQWDDALTFGEKTISELKIQNKSDKQLEILTYLSVCLNPNKQKLGCDAIKEYFAIHKQSLESLPYYEKYLTFYQSVCSGNNNTPLPSADERAAVIIHTNSGHAASLSAHFKSYEYMKLYSNFNSWIRKATYDNLQRIMGYRYPSDEVWVDTIKAKIGFQLFTAQGNHNPKDELLPYVKKVFHTDNFYVSGPLIIISPSYSSEQFKITAQILEETLNFYYHSLHIPYDHYLVFIYLAAEYTYNGIADVIQGIDPSAGYFPSAIGYSNTSMNTVVAWISSPDKPGTIKHELIHVLLKNNPLCPDWFEEGVAALYEESRFNKAGQLLGVNNWRLRFLRYLNKNQLLQLIDGLIFNNQAARTKFKDNIDAEAEKAANAFRSQNPTLYKYTSREEVMSDYDLGDNLITLCDDALSRYFLLYLQAKNKIGDILSAMLQNRDPLFYPGTCSSFESLLLEKLEFHSHQELETDFVSWLARQSAPNSQITDKGF